MPESKTTIDRYIDATSVQKELLLKFVIVFSRFEYALKRGGYRQKGDAAKPDWDKFAQECESLQPEAVLQLKTSGEYLISRPPGKQVYIDDDCLDFVPIKFANEPHLAEKLIRYIKTVRNNLFHGGKYPGKYIDEPGRNAELLESSIATLICLLKTNKKLQGLFIEV